MRRDEQVRVSTSSQLEFAGAPVVARFARVAIAAVAAIAAVVFDSVDSIAESANAVSALVAVTARTPGDTIAAKSSVVAHVFYTRYCSSTFANDFPAFASFVAWVACASRTSRTAWASRVSH
jgi:hypothetical protein